MKKIVHVITRFINGGAEENTLITCNYSAKIGDDVYLIIGKEFQKEILSKIHPKVKLIFIKNLKREINIFNDLLAFYRIYLFIKKIKPSIVHTHESKAGAIGRLAAFFSNSKIIIHTVHILPFLNVNIFKKFIYILIERLLSLITSQYICVSKGMLDQSLKYKIGIRKKYKVIHSGFDIKKFKKARKKSNLLKKYKSVNSKTKIILMLGAFEERKRHYEILKVFLKIIKFHKNTILLFVGSGKLITKIKQYVVKKKILNKVIFTGYKDDPENYIALSNICLMYSIREGLPKVVPQYIASGKPVITSNLPGIKEIVKNNYNGYIISMYNQKELYSKLSLLLSNSKILKKLSIGATKTDITKWSIDKMPLKINKLYNQLQKDVN